jgi:MFS family permease
MTSFQRDRFTWLAYLALGFYACIQGLLGPLVPFLRTELQLNYTISGLHLSAFALGMTLAGFTGAAVAQSIGRGRLFWLGGAGMGMGAILLAAGQMPYITILATFLMGILGSWLLVMIQATLADYHGAYRAIALTESNIIASMTATAAPLLVGLLARVEGIGWRGSLLLALPLWGVMFLVFRRVQIPENVPQTTTQKTKNDGKLPIVFYAYWVLTLCAGSIEWCVIFWGADFLEKVVGLAKTDASAAMSVFFLANVLGRIVGSRLVYRFASETLLLIAVIVTMLGFPIFWLAETPVLNLIGLFIAGAGIANLYPLTLTAASRAAPNHANIVSSRISLAMGLAILITPQILASVADNIGIKNAYTIVILLLGIVLGIILMARYMLRRSMSPANAS